MRASQFYAKHAATDYQEAQKEVWRGIKRPGSAACLIKVHVLQTQQGVRMWTYMRAPFVFVLEPIIINMTQYMNTITMALWNFRLFFVFVLEYSFERRKRKTSEFGWPDNYASLCGSWMDLYITIYMYTICGDSQEFCIFMHIRHSWKSFDRWVVIKCCAYSVGLSDGMVFIPWTRPNYLLATGIFTRHALLRHCTMKMFVCTSTCMRKLTKTN